MSVRFTEHIFTRYDDADESPVVVAGPQTVNCITVDHRPLASVVVMPFTATLSASAYCIVNFNYTPGWKGLPFYSEAGVSSYVTHCDGRRAFARIPVFWSMRDTGHLVMHVNTFTRAPLQCFVPSVTITWLQSCR